MLSNSRSRDFALVARTLLLDRQAVVATSHLQASGIPSILLKGPAIATWIYDQGEVRPYRDVDLLVPPKQFKTAIRLLAELGYVRRLPGAAAAEVGPKELDLVGPDDVCIDLHSGLLGASAPPEQCFDVLAIHTTTLPLGAGSLVTVLDVPARAMHLAMHLAQNGPVDVKAVADLHRGLERLERVQWRRAAAVAAEIGATEAFAAGLRLLPAGRELARDLALPTHMNVELALRVGSAPTQAIFFERLAEASGARRKVALVTRKVFPTEASLKDNSRIARRSKTGLVLARFWRPVSLAYQFPAALRAWFGARRATSVNPDEIEVHGQHMQAMQEQGHRAGHDYRSGSPHLKHWILQERFLSILRGCIGDLNARGLPLTVLEVGSGHGGYTAHELAFGCSVTATEMSRPSLVQLNATYGLNPRFSAVFDVDGSLDVLGEQRFSLVFCSSVLHHIPDYVGFLRSAVTNHLTLGANLLSIQDPLFYADLSHATSAVSKFAYLSWRATQGKYVQGVRTRLRRLRGIYDEQNPLDMTEYHVVRSGVDQKAILAELQPRFATVSVVPYWSTQSFIWQRLGNVLGFTNTFAIVATDFLG